GSPGPRGRRLRPRRPAGLPPELPAPESPLVGRAVEMRRLRQAWEAARRGQGQVVLVTGEARIGKSRPRAGVVGEAVQGGARALVGGCYEGEQILPLGPWVDAFRSGRVSADAALLRRLTPAWRAELGRLLPEAAEPGLPAPSDDRLRLF